MPLSPSLSRAKPDLWINPAIAAFGDLAWSKSIRQTFDTVDQSEAGHHAGMARTAMASVNGEWRRRLQCVVD